MMETKKIIIKNCGPWGPHIRWLMAGIWITMLFVVADLVLEAPRFLPSLRTALPTAFSASFLRGWAVSPAVTLYYSQSISFHSCDLEHGCRNGRSGPAARTVTSSTCGAEGWGHQAHQPSCWQESNAQALSAWTIKGKISEVRLIDAKGIMENITTPTLGGLELSSRESVAIYTPWKFVPLCVWECYIIPSMEFQLSCNVLTSHIWDIAWFTFKITEM